MIGTVPPSFGEMATGGASWPEVAASRNFVSPLDREPARLGQPVSGRLGTEWAPRRRATTHSRLGAHVANDVKGLEPHGPPSWSLVNLVLPLQSVGGNAAGMFALTAWALPRVPTIGEEIQAVGYRWTIERVTWDNEGNVVVRLGEAHVEQETVDALEDEGWKIAPWETEPPSEWFADR